MAIAPSDDQHDSLNRTEGNISAGNENESRTESNIIEEKETKTRDKIMTPVQEPVKARRKEGGKK